MCYGQALHNVVENKILNTTVLMLELQSVEVNVYITESGDRYS